MRAACFFGIATALFGAGVLAFAEPMKYSAREIENPTGPEFGTVMASKLVAGPITLQFFPPRSWTFWSIAKRTNSDSQAVGMITIS